MYMCAQHPLVDAREGRFNAEAVIIARVPQPVADQRSMALVNRDKSHLGDADVSVSLYPHIGRSLAGSRGLWGLLALFSTRSSGKTQLLITFVSLFQTIARGFSALFLAILAQILFGPQ